MSALIEKLQERFPDGKISKMPRRENDVIDLLRIETEIHFPITIIMTDGLADYEMPVRESLKGREFNELYFCLPSYWDIDDTDNPLMNWPLKYIQRLVKNVRERETWYGPGHTIANGKPAEPFSETMKQDHFLLADPIYLDKHLTPLEVDEKTIYFLAIIPLFYEEYYRKNHRGYDKWIQRFIGKDKNEILDDYRESIHKSRWFF